MNDQNFRTEQSATLQIIQEKNSFRINLKYRKIHDQT